MILAGAPGVRQRLGLGVAMGVAAEEVLPGAMARATDPRSWQNAYKPNTIRDTRHLPERALERVVLLRSQTLTPPSLRIIRLRARAVRTIRR